MMEPTKVIFIIGAVIGISLSILKIFDNKGWCRIDAIIELFAGIIGLVILYMLLFNKAIQGLILIIILGCPAALGFLIFVFIYMFMGK